MAERGPKLEFPAERVVKGRVAAIGQPRRFGPSFRVGLKIEDEKGQATWISVIGSEDRIRERLADVDVGALIQARCYERKWRGRDGVERTDLTLRSLEVTELPPPEEVPPPPARPPEKPEEFHYFSRSWCEGVLALITQVERVLHELRDKLRRAGWPGA